MGGVAPRIEWAIADDGMSMQEGASSQVRCLWLEIEPSDQIPWGFENADTERVKATTSTTSTNFSSLRRTMNISSRART